MDYELLFINYVNVLVLENVTLNSKKIYRKLLRELIKLSFLIFKEQKITNFKIVSLQDDLMLVENELVDNEPPYYILQSTCHRSPKGYNQLILKYQGKSKKLGLYLQLLNCLKNIIIDYYKVNKTNKDGLFVLQALLKITEYSYQKDLAEYKEQISSIIELLKKDEIPSIDRLDNIYELIKYVDEKLSQYEYFEPKQFQNEILKK